MIIADVISTVTPVITVTATVTVVATCDTTTLGGAQASRAIRSQLAVTAVTPIVVDVSPTVTDVTMSVSGVPVSCFTGLYVIPSYSYAPKRIGCPSFPPYMGGTRENK